MPIDRVMISIGLKKMSLVQSYWWREAQDVEIQTNDWHGGPGDGQTFI